MSTFEEKVNSSIYFKYPLLPFSASQYQGATMQLYFDHPLYNYATSSADKTQTTDRK